MRPDLRYKGQSRVFWANIRTISQSYGYAAKGQIKIPSLADVIAVYQRLGLTAEHLAHNGHLTDFGSTVMDYFHFRADILNNQIRILLMNAGEAKRLFESTRKQLRPKCPLPMNKQKGKKHAPAYLTGLVNMLIESSIGAESCDYDPRALTTVTRDSVPVRTLARRVDGAFPSSVNPVALWEIKEYYYTTTFGSRIADGVYESLLDGMELEELRDHEGIDVKHYLIVDAYDTWWNDGKSYLCRLVDMMHMEYVDEVVFREVVDRMPTLAKAWVNQLKAKSATRPEDVGRGHQRG